MKKLLHFFAISVLLFSCAENDDFAPSSTIENSRILGNDNVKLIRAEHKSRPIYENETNTDALNIRTFLVRVKNLTYEKKVYIHHEMKGLPWKDFELKYVKSEDGEDIFGLTINIPYQDDTFGNEFVVKYLVNGKTYWDNNNGENYLLEEGSYINNESQTMVQLSYAFFNSFTDIGDRECDEVPLFGEDGDIIDYDLNCYYVENLNRQFQLEVFVNSQIQSEIDSTKVVYTYDNWKTTHIYPVKYGNSFFNIIEYGPEIESVEFAIVTKINGIEYWDNNNGKNYKLSINENYSIIPYSWE
ncbi:MAG: hypothetical protein H6604_02890 [Flavobacteriales bacterium]|nr:hypothetical protein [Flavobacteriales bacterium]